jgi:hypothetical protein
VLDIPIRRKSFGVLLVILFGLPALAVLVVPFRSAGIFWPDYAFLFPLIGVYGVFFREGLLSLPFGYEWGMVFLVYLWLLRARHKVRPLRAGAAWNLLWRVLLVFLALRILLVPGLTATVVLYRNFQASLSMVLATLLLAGTAGLGNRKKPSPRAQAVIGVLFLLFAAATARVLTQVPPDPSGLAVGGAIGLAWWWFFVSPGRRRAGFVRCAIFSLAWYGLTLLLLVPDFLWSYHAYVKAAPKIRWVTRQEFHCYDVLPWHRDGWLFAAQNDIARYSPDDNRPPISSKEFVGGQRLDMDPETRRIFMPSFMRYHPQEERFEDVYIYDFDLNLVDTLRLPECVGPLYVQYSGKRDHLYYSCEASGHLTAYDFGLGNYRTFGDYLSPNHILLDEEEDRLIVSPILEPRLDVYDLNTLERIETSPVVPPVYVCVTDARRNALYVARFVLGDMEIRDLNTLRVLSYIRLDMGPRDMDRDWEGKRVFACSYFTGTLCVVDLERKAVGRLFAGPRARGLFYDPEADRLYFCSTLGIGYYDGEALAEPVAVRGIATELADLVRGLFQAGGVSRLIEFLSLFRTLT